MIQKSYFHRQILICIDILPNLLVWFFIVVYYMAVPLCPPLMTLMNKCSPLSLVVIFLHILLTHHIQIADSMIPLFGVFLVARYTKSLTFCLLKSLHALWIEAIVTLPYDQSMTNDIFCVMCVHYMYTICSRLLTTDSIIMHP